MTRPKTNVFLEKLVAKWRDKYKILETKIKSEKKLNKKLLIEIADIQSKITKLAKKLDNEKLSHEVTCNKLSKVIVKNKKLSSDNTEASNTIKVLKANIRKQKICEKDSTQHSAVYWKKLYLSELARR